MSEHTDQDKLEHIKSAYENSALTIGTLLAMILVAFFFTYSALADSSYASWLWVKGAASILMIVVLIYIRRVAFSLTRFRFKNRAGYQDIFNKLSLSDL